jgi:hypothetical protein
MYKGILSKTQKFERKIKMSKQNTWVTKRVLNIWKIHKLFYFLYSSYLKFLIFIDNIWLKFEINKEEKEMKREKKRKKEWTR